jgi:prepilin-type N-terminal cleavage/methylation domain-containing protein/prepilin-type processing-associated H-X9-DG protein
MRVWRTSLRNTAFTLVELLVVVAIIGIMAALLLPVLSKGQLRARRIACVSNLKQMGDAFHLFAHEHNGKFPMQVASAEGGSLEFVNNGYAVHGDFYFSYRHFQTLSNDLVNAKLVFCPSELYRQMATNFAALRNENVSYFVGVNADFAQPGSVLAGDRNITNEFEAAGTIVRSGFGTSLHWTSELHRYKGNILFADSHVEQWNDVRLDFGRNLAALNADLVLPTPGGGRGPGPGGSAPAIPSAQSSGSGGRQPRSASYPGSSSSASGGSTAMNGGGGTPMPVRNPQNESGETLGIAEPLGSSTEPEITSMPKREIRFSNTISAPTLTVRSNQSNVATNEESAGVSLASGLASVHHLAGTSMLWLWLLLLLLLVPLIIFYIRRRKREQKKQMVEE